MKTLYNYLDKRLSVRKIDKENLLTQDDLNDILSYLDELVPLFPNIDVSYKLVQSKETTSKIGEYQLLIYSSKPNTKNSNYLLNIGYMLEQLDLYLFSKNIGSCWLGLPKPKTDYKNDNYVIMIGLTKINHNILRKDNKDFNRKQVKDIWMGTFDKDVMNKSILAPSACNSQSWKVKVVANTLEVYRDKNIKTIIPRGFRKFFNSIDLGIFLCFLEISMMHNEINFTKEIINDENDPNDLILIAKYFIN